MSSGTGEAVVRSSHGSAVERSALRVLLATDALRDPDPGTDAARVTAGAADLGWSIVWLPPPALPDAAAATWFEAIASVVTELGRRRLEAVLLLDESEPPDRRALAKAAVAGAIAADRVFIADVDADADAILAALGGAPRPDGAARARAARRARPGAIDPFAPLPGMHGC